MKEKKSIFGLSVSRLLFCFIAFYFIFFSEKANNGLKPGLIYLNLAISGSVTLISVKLT